MTQNTQNRVVLVIVSMGRPTRWTTCKPHLLRTIGISEGHSACRTVSTVVCLEGGHQIETTWHGHRECEFSGLSALATTRMTVVPSPREFVR
jgi:hypothetical protein